MTSMTRVLLLCTVSVVVAVYGAPARHDSDLIPPDIRDLIPSQVIIFLNSLSRSEKVTLVRIVIKHVIGAYNNENVEAAAELKQKAPKLYEKITKMAAEMEENENSLGNEGKAFVDDIAAWLDRHQFEARFGLITAETFKAMFDDYAQKYSALSTAAKADLDQKFPVVMTFLKNPNVHALVKKALNREISREMSESFNALGSEAKTFLSAIGTEISLHYSDVNSEQMTLKAFRSKLMTYVKKYNSLSDSAKGDLKKNFPFIMSVLKNVQLHSLVKQALYEKM